MPECMPPKTESIFRDTNVNVMIRKPRGMVYQNILFNEDFLNRVELGWAQPKLIIMYCSSLTLSVIPVWLLLSPTSVLLG